MENAEEIMHSLEEFSKLKPKDIPRELEDYLGYVAKTGDPVFKWSIIKCLFREKMLNVITDFYESTLTMELPPCPNVDPFNYERMKANLLEKLDSFPGAPFTVQRISELLTNPRKEYNRADKFMRAIEKNILVVSTREPGRYTESDSEGTQETSYNGIPETNESNITSFSCNDLADPDSSSQTYQVVNSVEQKTYQSTVSTSYVPPTPFKDISVNPDESMDIVNATKNVVGEVTVCTEKETNETVICSTVSLGSGHVLIQTENKNGSLDEKTTEIKGIIIDKGNLCEEVEKVNKQSTVPCSDNKEAVSIEVFASDNTNTVDEIAVKPDSNMVGNIESNENIIIPTSSNEHKESINSVTSDVLDEDQPVECDTSNSFDSEATNLFETSEVTVSENSNESSQEVHTTENNEATASSDLVNSEKSNDSSEINESTETDKNKNESETLTSTENMEVGECQISLVDQSDS